jgi:hypothetical protein
MPGLETESGHSTTKLLMDARPAGEHAHSPNAEAVADMTSGSAASNVIKENQHANDAPALDGHAMVILPVRHAKPQVLVILVVQLRHAQNPALLQAQAR